MKTVKIRAWAIFCKTLPINDAIVDIAFIGVNDTEAKQIKMSKKMFVDENGIYHWQDNRYKLIPCTVSFIPPRA